jgi:hypothetical protein
MYKNNIIDLKSHRNLKKTLAKGVSPVGVPENRELDSVQAPIVDMTERRTAILNDERRDVRRTILTGFIGAFVLLPKFSGSPGGLLKVDIYDISENGIAFDIDAALGQFKKGEEIAMRVYLSQDTYFPFIAKIQNSRLLTGEAVSRHGANFIKGTVNDEALMHFVKFIETVSASLERDSGDVMVSGLKK